MTVSQLNKLIGDVEEAALEAEQAAAEARWVAEQAEQKRLKEQEAAAEEAAEKAKQAQHDAYAKALRNFDWPRSNCDRPSSPSINSSNATRDRANRKLKEWHDCLDNSAVRDTRAIRDVVRAIGGDWSVASGTITWNSHNKKFNERIRELFDYRDQRADARSDQIETFNDAVGAWNDRQSDKEQKEEFWDGINDSLDQMNRDMDRMNQQRQQQWNQQIYISPGYN